MAAVIQCYNAAIGERKLKFALALLARYLARYASVNLVREPILAGNGLQLEHARYIFVECLAYVRVRIAYVFVVPYYRVVPHVGLGRVAEHLRHVEVERLNAIALHETEVGVARGFADNIQRSALAFGYFAHVLDVLLVDEQAHALLALVGYYLLA